MKKHQQLGMNPSTASNRLVKDTLFRLAVEAGHKCFRCGNALDRDSFSIEHKVAWLDSEDPLASYFDQSNIAFSHLSCNAGHGARPHKKYTPEEAKAATKVRLYEKNKRLYTPEKRHAAYLKYGQ